MSVEVEGVVGWMLSVEVEGGRVRDKQSKGYRVRQRIYCYRVGQK